MPRSLARSPHTVDDRRRSHSSFQFLDPYPLIAKVLAAAHRNSELSREVQRKMEIRRTAQQEAEQAKAELARWKKAYDEEMASSKLKLDEITSLSQQLKDTSAALGRLQEEIRVEREKRYDQFYKLRDAQADCELLESYLSKSIVARFHGEPEDGSRLAIDAYKARRARSVKESANPPTKEEQDKPDDTSTRGHEDGSKE